MITISIIVAGLCVVFYFVRFYSIKSDSMAPTLLTGDVVLAIRKSAKISDIVTFKHGDGKTFVKRLSGIPDSSHFFLTGDNYRNSFDSRYFGPVEKEKVKFVVTRVIGNIYDNNRSAVFN